MSEPATKSSFDAQLQALRARIDALDDRLIALIKERTGIIQEVAVLKRAHTPNDCHIRPAREGQMHKRIYEAFKGSDFNVHAAVIIWRHLISASTHLESPLKVISSAPRHLGHEYFGHYVDHHDAADSEEAVRSVSGKQANIAIIPTQDIALLEKHPTLKIFAALPVIGNKVEAVAIAALAPEPSGDDVSYFIDSDRHVVSVAGFVKDRADSVWVGTHPAQLRKE
ncbi:MAG: chorismate mutase [Alphaproteobacteria bacterium]|nr:chorismate mutase [Alphaproteobacteria bacterium]